MTDYSEMDYYSPGLYAFSPSLLKIQSLDILPSQMVPFSRLNLKKYLERRFKIYQVKSFSRSEFMYGYWPSG